MVFNVGMGLVFPLHPLGFVGKDRQLVKLSFSEISQDSGSMLFDFSTFGKNIIFPAIIFYCQEKIRK